MSALIFVVVLVVYLRYSSRSPEHCLAASAVLLPFNQYLPQSGVPFVNIQNLVTFGAIWALMRAKGQSGRPAAPAAVVVFAAVVTLGYLKNFVTEVPGRYAFYYDSWVNFLLYKEWMTTLFFYYVAFVVVDGVRKLRVVLWGCTIGFGAELVFCFLELIFKAAKVTGHMGEKNTTGAFLATYAAFCLGAYLALDGGWLRRMYGSMSLMGAAAAVGTRSRGGILAVGASLLLLSLLKNRLLAIVLIGMAVTYQAWMPEAVLERFDKGFETDASGQVELADTGADRVEIWKAGLRTIPDYPLGVGLGRYHLFVPPYGLEGLLSNPMKNAHNEFVRVTVELSIVGLVVLLWLVARVALDGWTAGSRDPDVWGRAVGLGTFAAILGACAANIALNLLFAMNIDGVLWVLAGMASRRAAEIRAERRRR